MNVLIILQGTACGDERAYNGLRLAGNLAKSTTSPSRSSASATRSAVQLQPATPQRLLPPRPHADVRGHHGAEIGLCGSCMDARGISAEMLMSDAHRSSLDEVTDWTLWAVDSCATSNPRAPM